MISPTLVPCLSETRTMPGWLLGRLIACDEINPGTLRRYHTGSVWRRHCIAMVLGDPAFNTPDVLAARLRRLDQGGEGENPHPLAVISRAILHRRVCDIVRCLHPDAEGLSGLLRKLGSEPLAMRDYAALVGLCTQPERHSRVALLRHVPKIPRQAIHVLAALDPPFVLSPLLLKLGSVEQAKDFRRSIELIRRVIPGVSDEQLVSSLMSLKPEANLKDWIRRWLSRATTFWVEPPFQDDEEIVCLHSAAAMNDAARRFQNCLSGKLSFCALGRALYLEYLPNPVVIELAILDRGYLLEGLYGPQNAAVDQETALTILRKLKLAGVLVPSRDAQASRYNRVARIARIHDFGRDDLIGNDVFEFESESADAA